MIMKKSIGIIGAGNIGKTVARHLVNAGFSVTISNSSGPESLAGTVAELGNGAVAGTIQQAAAADIVLLALPWGAVPGLAGVTDWTDKVVIDATNHFITFAPDFQLADLGGKASSQVVAGYVPGARVVKSFNTLYFKILEKNPQEAGGRRVMFLSGDDGAAKTDVAAVIDAIGFAPVDLGDLATSSKLQQPKQALASLNLIRL
nr:NAD(P)-binding domain-containing protein [Filimonas zeae]